ncbi:MAG: PilT/PilU family type 4a pilus ATPase [Candidatus Magasanikbacteria bacterium]
MKTLKAYFDFAQEKNVSDLHLVGEELPYVRANGKLINIEETPLPNADLEKEILSILNPEQQEHFVKEMELDFGFEQNGARFRVNLHRQNGKIGLSARLIPNNIPTPEQLHFEPALMNFMELKDGLVLVVGPTGEGKSTTLATMIEHINQTRKAHVITIEDPIEFIFKDKECLIEQREVGIDTHSFAEALKHVLRQDPNVILVGEMRDPETISTVLTAAETGHLVFSTLHTSTAAEAIERIVDVFEGGKQKQVLTQLSAVLRGVVSQQLIPALDGSRVAVREILVNTPAVSNLIRENNIAQIQSAIQTGADAGMIPMENAVLALEKSGVIDKETAERRIGRQRKV